MKRKLKGLLSLWLAVMMVLTAVPMAFAEGETAEIAVYTGTESLNAGATLASITTATATLQVENGEYSLSDNAVLDEIASAPDATLLSGWKLWTIESDAIVDCDEYDLDAKVNASELTGKILEPVWAACEITQQPTVAKPTVKVSDAESIRYEWYTATVSDSDVIFGDAVDGQTEATLSVEPSKDASYACKITLTDIAGNSVVLKSDAVTYTEVEISFDANGGEGEMDDETIVTGTKFELPECEFEGPDDTDFYGWTIETDEDTDEVIYEPGDEILITEAITIYAKWQVATPVVSPSNSSIYTSTAITIDCSTSGATIYYTTNGNEPTTSSTKYTGSFVARTNPTVIKAIAVKEGMADSEIVTKNYAIITLGLSGSSGGSYGVSTSSSYTVKFDTNGGLTIANQYVKKNGFVTEPENPTKYGYTFIGWYTDKQLTEEYDFDTEVTKSFTLYAKWESDGSESDSAPADTSLFDDVADDAWYYDAVKYACENGLINGMSDNEFGPAVHLNRAMLVTILYRADGSPAISGATNFSDIESGLYYENPVMWAEENAIVNGMSDTEFGPSVLITREQFATILYRYASYKGYIATDAVYNEVSAPDADVISDWAKQPIAYCVENKIINGYEDNSIGPKGNTTRAEAAAMLQRFIEAN